MVGIKGPLRENNNNDNAVNLKMLGEIMGQTPPVRRITSSSTKNKAKTYDING